MKQINEKDTVYAITNQYPELTNILVDFGFIQMKLPQMLQTAGRIMTLEKGCMMRGFDYNKLKEILKEHGFEVVS